RRVVGDIEAGKQRPVGQRVNLGRPRLGNGRLDSDLGQVWREREVVAETHWNRQQCFGGHVGYGTRMCHTWWSPLGPTARIPPSPATYQYVEQKTAVDAAPASALEAHRAALSGC